MIRRIALSLAFLAGVTACPLAAATTLAEYESMEEAQLRALLPEQLPAEQGRLHILLGRISMDRDLSLARAHLNKAKPLIDDDDLEAQAYLSVGWCWMHILESRLDSAVELCEDSVALAEESSSPWALTKTYGAHALLEYQRGNLDRALVLGKQASEQAELTGHSTTIATQLNAMGLILRAQGLYEEGLSHFARGLEALNFDKSADVELYQIMNFNVGLSHGDLGDHKLAKDYYDVGLTWARESKRYAKELTALVYIAIADIELGQPEVALEQLSRAIRRPEMQQNEGYLAFAYAVIGDAHSAMGNFFQARQAYEQGLELAAGNPNTYEQRRLFSGYAKALFELGEVDDARAILKQAIEQAEGENSFGYLLQSLKTLAAVEEKAQNFGASLAAYKRAQVLTQEFQKQIVERELALLRADFELEEKERALEDARQEAILRNGFFMFVLAIVFIAYLFVSRRIQAQRAEERAEQARELERVVEERTLELQQQIKQVTAAESANVALERQLAEADKLRMLGQLTGGVAHDFNNLLTVILGAAELLHDRLKDDEDYRNLLDHILTAAASGADITRALMAYARKQPMRLERVNLNEFLTERIPLLARTLGGMVNLEFAVKVDDVVEVVLDSSQLTTAMLNLAINARDAQSKKGSVKVSLRVRDDKWAVIEVKDRGVGMDAEQIERAVEPFFTTKPEQGNGLGLSMVYGFSKQLGGDLEIESELGKGTRVAIVLPLADAPGAEVKVMTQHQRTPDSTEQLHSA